MRSHILIVEDDPVTRMALTYRLSYAGYHVTQATDGETAIELLEQQVFDVVLTDIVLGTIDGIEVLHTARLQTYRPEVILLTGHATLDTSIAAIRAGACDYLQKPCSDEALLTCLERAVQRHSSEKQICQAARNILAAFAEPHLSGRRVEVEPTTGGERGSPPASGQVLVIGDLVIGKTRHEVTFQGQTLHITPMEYALLRYLAERPGQLCAGQDIVRYTHGLDTDAADAQTLLRSHIRNIRKKMSPDYLVNDRGNGYMLVDPTKKLRY